MDEILKRVWENLIGRSTGPMNFRLIVQPLVAMILGARAGLKDARQGRPAFLWSAATNSAYRPEMLRQGWKDLGRVFVLAVIIDSIYQLVVQRGVYVLELLIVAITLAIIPDILIRGPVNRIRKMLARE